MRRWRNGNTKEVGCWYYDEEYKMRYENGVEDKDWEKGPFYINFLNKVGSEGWEMVACGISPGLGDDGSYPPMWFYFKRRLA